MMQETEGQVASSGAGVANAQEIIALRNIQFDHSSCTEVPANQETSGY